MPKSTQHAFSPPGLVDGMGLDADLIKVAPLVIEEVKETTESRKGGMGGAPGPVPMMAAARD